MFRRLLKLFKPSWLTAWEWVIEFINFLRREKVIEEGKVDATKTLKKVSKSRRARDTATRDSVQ